MDMTKVDKNFLQNTEYNEEDTTLYSPLEKPFSLHGVFFDSENGYYARLPYSLAKSVSGELAWLSRHTSGGRIRFSTDSQNVTLIVKYTILEPMSHMPVSGSAGFILNEVTLDGEKFVAGVRPELSEGKGFVRKMQVEGGKMRSYTLYLPLYNEVTEILIGLDKGAKLEEGTPYKNIPPVLYYGSSITQGGCANRPDNSYQAIIHKQNNVDFINLGFSGNAKAEECVVEYLASLDCSIAVLDYDHNALTVEYLNDTHYRMYEIYRKARPNTPIVFISRPDHRFDDETLQRYEVIKATYDKAKKLGDKNVYFIDGRTLFYELWDSCLVEGLHPTDLGFYQMSVTIGKVVNKILKKILKKAK